MNIAERVAATGAMHPNDPFFDCFRTLAKSIHSLAEGRPVIYIPNPGNLGDGLIRQGIKAFLADNDIWHYELNLGFSKNPVRWRMQLLPFLVQRKYLFLYGGGGAWLEGSSSAESICNFISRFTDRLVIMPTTFGKDVRGIKGVHFRRDCGISKHNNPQSEFCHDMAFYLFNASVRQIELEANDGSGTLVALRTDMESARPSGSLPDGNHDLSVLGDHMCNAETLYQWIRPFEHVVTDRLHVSIAAAFLGKHVTLHANNYPKIRDIYHASLSKVTGTDVNFIG